MIEAYNNSLQNLIINYKHFFFKIKIKSIETSILAVRCSNLILLKNSMADSFS